MERRKKETGRKEEERKAGGDADEQQRQARERWQNHVDGKTFALTRRSCRKDGTSDQRTRKEECDTLVEI